MAIDSEFSYGYVVGQLVLAKSDGDDLNRLPDFLGQNAKVTFTRIQGQYVQPVKSVRSGIRALMVSHQPVVAGLMSDGTITGDVDSNAELKPDAKPGLWLVVGQYNVNFGDAFPSTTIEVKESHTEDDPLDIASAIGYKPAPNHVVTTVELPRGGEPGQVYGWNGVGIGWYTPPGSVVDETTAQRAESAAARAESAADSMEATVNEVVSQSPTDSAVAAVMVQPNTQTRAALEDLLSLSVRGATPVGVIAKAGDVEVQVPLSSTQARTMYAVVYAEKGLATSNGGYNVVRFGASNAVDGRVMFITKDKTTILEAAFSTRNGHPSANVPLGGPGAGIGVPTIIWASADDLTEVAPAIRVGGETGTVIGERRDFAIGDGFGGGLFKRDLRGLFRVPYVALYPDAHNLEERREVIRQLRARYPYPTIPAPEGPRSSTLTDFRKHSTIPEEWVTEDTTWGIVREVLRDTRTA